MLAAGAILKTLYDKIHSDVEGIDVLDRGSGWDISA
jgi:hypothetical protein